MQLFAALLVAVGYAIGDSGVGPETYRDIANRWQPNVPETSTPAATDAYSYQRPSADQLVEARVANIIDGDTRSAGEKSSTEWPTDSPERGQPYGAEATHELATLITGKVLQVEERGPGGFGRIAARVFVGPLDVNYEMVRRGAGWFDPEHAKDEDLFYVEEAARDANVGLWSLPRESRFQPWVWRDMPKKERDRYR